MSNDVFANGREISCKKADGKTICEFPDVCFTPPENPATPPGVPVPYPNTAFAKDTTDGSKNVKISGQEVMLKNQSYFKTSTGDEAGCAAKKGVITSTNKGKAYFKSWSMDVKFEGENVVRHLDITTNNHASDPPTGGVTQVHPDSQAPPISIDPCEAAANIADKADEFGPKKATRITKDENGKETTVTYDTVPAGGLFIPAGGIPALPNVAQSGISLMSHSSVSARDIRPNTKKGRMSGGQGGGVACPGKTFPVRKAGHAEVKMIEDILVGRYPGSLTSGAFKPKGTLYLTVKRKEICCSCQEAIKCAEAQGIKFVYCKDNEGKETTKRKCP